MNDKPRYNCVFARNNSLGIKNGAYVKNLDDEKSKGTYWVSLFIDRNTAVYFHYFGVEYISQKVINKIRDKSDTDTIFRMQDNDTVMC